MHPNKGMKAVNQKARTKARACANVHSDARQLVPNVGRKEIFKFLYD